MLEFEEKMLDMDIAKINNDFHTFLEFLSISEKESRIIGVATESAFETVKAKLKEVGRKTIEAIHRFIYNAILKAATKMEEMSINSKLKAAKEKLLEKRQEKSNYSLTYMDIRKYKAAYSDFIKTYVKEFETGMHKNFKSKDDFKEWQNKMVSKFDEFNLTLSENEKWTLTDSINKVIKDSEENSHKLKDNFITINRDSTEIIQKLSKAISEDKGESDDYSADKQSLIVFLMRKISQLVRTVVSFIFKHTFLCITAIIVAVAAQG